MTRKVKAKSRILEAVHETASDLHRLGFINKRKMHELEALCLTIEMPEYDAEKIRAIRDRYKLSQSGTGFDSQYQSLDCASVGDWKKAPKRSVQKTAQLT